MADSAFADLVFAAVEVVRSDVWVLCLDRLPRSFSLRCRDFNFSRFLFDKEGIFFVGAWAREHLTSVGAIAEVISAFSQVEFAL